MSIEKALADLTAALVANTAALASIKGAATAAAGNKPATTAGNKPATSTKPKTKTDDELRAAFGSYLTTSTIGTKEERKANIAAILAQHEAAQVTAILAEKREAALADLAIYADGGTPEWAAAPAGEDDGDDMLG